MSTIKTVKCASKRTKSKYTNKQVKKINTNKKEEESYIQ